jgi:hypothetical protein
VQACANLPGSDRYHVNLEGPTIQDELPAPDYKRQGPGQTRLLTPGRGA